MFKLHPHRYLQLLGLYGVLFLIPVLQYVVNAYSGMEEDSKREQTQSIVEHVYYDVKTMTCELLGQQATSHDCAKGIYQDIRLKGSIERANKSAEKKSESYWIYWFVYYLFAIFGFWGTFIEYRKEYERST